MRLSVRVTVFSSIFAIAIASVFALAGHMQSNANSEMFLRSNAANVDSVITSLFAQNIGVFEAHARTIGRERQMIKLLSGGDAALIADEMASTFNRIAATGEITHLTLFNAEGQPIVAFPEEDPATGTPGIVMEALGSRKRVHGLIEIGNGRTGEALAFPLMKGRTVVGIGLIAVSTTSLVPLISETLSADLVVIEGGTQTGGTENAPSLDQIPGLFVDGSISGRLLEIDDRHLLMSHVPLRNSAGDVLGKFIVFGDVTEARVATIASSRTIIGGAVLTGLIGVFLLAWWLRREFSTVRAVAETLDRLARGEHVEPIASGNRKDEVATLRQAVSRLSADTERMAEQAQRISVGDLTVDVRPRSEDDRLGHALAAIVERLGQTISDADEAARKVAEIAVEMRYVAGSVQDGSDRQQASAQQASAAIEEMSANMRHSSENARETESIADTSAIEAERSGEASERAVVAMGSIDEKISMVQEIARQTDLLALNAAVEAARAGAHGRGFSVVASEVRKLAERAQATAEEVQRISHEAVSVSRTAGDSLQGMLPGIRRTAELVGEISTAMQEQALGTEQINDALRDLDRVMQKNALIAKQAAEKSDSLAEQSERLAETISSFKLHDGGTAIVVPSKSLSSPESYAA